MTGRQSQDAELDNLLASIRRAIHDEDRASERAPSAAKPAAAAPVAATSRPIPARGVPDDIRALRDKINSELSRPEKPAPEAAPAPAKPFTNLFRQPQPVSRPAPLRPAAAAPRAPMAQPEAPKLRPRVADHTEFAPLAPEAPPAAPQLALDPALLSVQAAHAAAQSFGRLAQAMPRSEMERGFEQMTREMLQPMLRQWLDAHLPAIVERLVREEIERVARRGNR